MSNNKTKGILISFVLGSAIGSAIALLYAPKSGKHLRKDISRKTNELIDDGKRKSYDTWNGAKEKVENTIDSANELLNAGVEKIGRKKEKVIDALKTGIGAYDEERKSGKNQSNSYTEDAENLHKQRI